MLWKKQSTELVRYNKHSFIFLYQNINNTDNSDFKWNTMVNIYHYECFYKSNTNWLINGRISNNR